MKKAMLVSVAVIVCTAIAFAQETPSGGAAGQNTSQTPSATQTPEESSSGTPIQGCLKGSAGSYVLTDPAGVAYKLQGGESQLADYVNKEVEVMGTVGSTAAGSKGEHAGEAAGGVAGEAAGHAAGEAGHAAGEAAGEAVHASKTLEVSSVKKLAEDCSMNK